MSKSHNPLLFQLSITGSLALAAAGAAIANPFGDAFTRPRQPATQQVGGPGTLVLQQHTFQDAGTGNMPSHTILVPKNWTAEGSAWWPNANYFNILPSHDIKVRSPEGVSLHLGPAISASDFRPSAYAQQLGVSPPQQGASDGGRIVFRRPDSLQEWGHLFETFSLPQVFPNAASLRVTNVVVLPELTEILRRQLRPISQQYQMMNGAMAGAGMRSFVEAEYIGIEFTFDEDGQRHEGLTMFSVTTFGSDSPTGRSLLWSCNHNLLFHAPQGQLTPNMPTLMTIANSLQTTSQWSRMLSSHIAKMNGISARGAAQRSRIIADTNREISQIITDGYNSRNRIMDETHRKYVNSIRGVDDYVANDGSQVQLPSGYDHVYSDGMGNYILTNDALFQPNVDLGGTRNWNPMNMIQ